MNFRLTAILFGVIFVAGVVLLILSFSGEGDTVSPDALAEELASVKPDQIDTVEIEREGGSKLKLVRSGKDHWNEEWDETTPGGKQHLSARADTGAVNELVSSLLKAKPTTHPELSTNPAVHGLQPPGLKVTLRQGSERFATINFGEVTSGGRAVAFVTTSARPNRPLATPRDAVAALFRDPGWGKAVDLAKWANDYRVKNVFADASSIDQVTAISLSTKGKSLGLVRAGSGWVFNSPMGWGAADSIGDPAKPLSGVNPLINTITTLRAASAGDFVETPTPQQLTEYGLNEGNPEAVRVEITNKDNEKLVAFIGKADNAAPATPPVPGQPQGEKVWVRVEGQPGVIRVTSSNLGGLRGMIENPDPLRDRTLLALDKPRIDGIDISTGARLRKVGGEWKLFGPPTPNEPQLTNHDVVNHLLDALMLRRTIKAFPSLTDAQFAPGAARVELKVWADGFEPSTDPKTEPKSRDTAKPTTLIFGRPEGDSVYVRRILPDGSKADFLVADKVKLDSAVEPVDLVSALKLSRLDLLDPALKSFSPEIANAITVSGAASYELKKADSPTSGTGGDHWTFASPSDKKGQTADAAAVGEMLGLLGTTKSVTKFVNEAPDEAALIGYGLAAAKMPPKGAPPAPRLKVTIGLKTPDDKDRIFEFGNPAPEASFVYARLAGKAAVFTVPRLVYDKFANPDLRDRAIFSDAAFDPAAITAIDIKGWKDKFGKVTELHLEKKDGVWAATKSPMPNFMASSEKINAFLTGLKHLRIKSFVAGGVKPEHGFGGDQPSLGISLKTQKGPLINLNVGSLTGGADKAYYLHSSWGLPLSSPVCTVEAAAFQEYKDGPAAFAR